jgi:glycine dehydrogenase subunit 1
MMVAQAKKRYTVLVSNTLLPHVRGVIATYAKYAGITIKEIAQENGQTSKSSLEALIAQGDVAGAIVPSVNRFGIIENLEGMADALHADKAMLTVYCDPSALAVVKTPAEWGADVAVGDGQPLGIPLCYGGPYVGFMACRQDYMRKLPGRIVGQTTDKEGRRAFVLTLQAREQHIRREKATSNICSNQSLMALYVTIYMGLMGAKGLKEVNEISYSNAHYLAESLVKTGLFEMAYPDKPFLNEFAVKTKLNIDELQQYCNDEYMQCGLKIADDTLLIAVTETYSREDCDDLVDACVTFNEEKEGK